MKVFLFFSLLSLSFHLFQYFPLSPIFLLLPLYIYPSPFLFLSFPSLTFSISPFFQIYPSSPHVFYSLSPLFLNHKP
jgi:hypothetical protein